ALGLHVVAMDEAQRRRVDAVAQSAAIPRPVREHVPEMTVAVRRADLGANHAVAGVAPLVDVRGLDGLGEARPSAARFELVGGREQRLSRHDVDVDAGFLVVQVLPGSGHLGAVLLGHAILLRGQPGDDVGILAVLAHGFTSLQAGIAPAGYYTGGEFTV